MGNLCWDSEAGITLFDFDDCLYGHYIYDIAMVFFYSTMSDDDPLAEVHRLLGPFTDGYVEETTLTRDIIKAIPLFMKLREIDLYAVIHRSFDLETTDDTWVKNFMDERRERIVDNVPWMDLK